jgi:hypothetical protein
LSIANIGLLSFGAEEMQPRRCAHIPQGSS